MDINAAIDLYIRLREAKKRIQKKQVAELAPVLAGMERLEVWFLNDLQKVQRAKSVVTNSGTVYLSTVLKPKIEDGSVFLDFLVKNNLLHMLELRASVSAVEQFLEAHKVAPPGLSIKRETFARIRK